MAHDKNGNRTAVCHGGPMDGEVFLVWSDEKDDSTFVPARIRGSVVNRPVYRLESEKYIFVGFDPDPDCAQDSIKRETPK